MRLVYWWNQSKQGFLLRTKKIAKRWKFLKRNPLLFYKNIQIKVDYNYLMKKNLVVLKFKE